VAIGAPGGGKLLAGPGVTRFYLRQGKAWQHGKA
jgi:hypothetical protein